MDLESLSLLTAPVSPKSTIENSYIDVTVRENVFPSGAFSIALPKGWRIDQDSPGAVPGPSDPVVPLARFAPELPDALGALERPQIVVWVAFLPREIHGADWLHTWIDSQGFSTIQARELPAKNGIMGDALVHRSDDNKTMLHRLLTVKDGDLLFLVDGRVEVSPMSYENLEDMQEIFLMAMLRFKLLEASAQNYAEAFDPQTLTGANGKVAILVPSSWEVESAEDYPDAGSAILIKNVHAESIVGSMLVTLGGIKDSAEEIETVIRHKLVGQGYEIAAAGTVLAQRTTDTTTLQILRYDGQVDGNAIAVLSARVSFDGLPVSVFLISPTASVSFEAWAINRRAFDIALSSLQRV